MYCTQCSCYHSTVHSAVVICYSRDGLGNIEYRLTILREEGVEGEGDLWTAERNKQ